MTIDELSRTTTFSYTQADHLHIVSNLNANLAWTNLYDAEGRVVTNLFPDGALRTFAYDAMGAVTQVVQGGVQGSVQGGVTTRHTYDALGLLTSTTIDSQLVLSNQYDGLGRLTVSIDAHGIASTNTWDAWGLLATNRTQGGLMERYQYADRGLTNVIDRLGIPTTLVRDNIGRVLAVLDGETNQTSFTYAGPAGFDEIATLTDGQTNLTTWLYDRFGNVTNKTYHDASFAAWHYDALHRLRTNRQPDGVLTTFDYDPAGNLTQQVRGTEAPISFAYDALDRLTNLVDAVGTTRWEYDARSRLTAETGPFGTLVEAGYDERGFLTNLVFGAYTWVYEVDALGRIRAIHAPEGEYTLDPWGNSLRTASITYPNDVIQTIDHDLLGRVDSVAIGGHVQIDYEYDANSRRTNEVWSSGRAIRYGYDRIGQVTNAVGVWPADDAVYRYDRAGNPVHRRELGLGVTNNFNSLNQIEGTTVNVARVTMLGEVNYPMGTVTVGSVQAVLHGTTFEAPNVPVAMGSNVLTAIYQGPGFTNTGHMATATVGMVISNRLYEHDTNGNLTNDAVFAYAWDAANQLTNVVRLADDARVLSMRYDALGRRVEVTRADDSIERYVYIPGTFMVLAVLDGDNEIKELYTHGPDLSGTLGGAGGIGGILADFRPQTSDLRSLHSDAMGNIVLATDESGAEAARYRYTPFGREIHREGDYGRRGQSRHMCRKMPVRCARWHDNGRLITRLECPVIFCKANLHVCRD